MHELREKVARAIADANGDVFDNAFVNKARWVAKRGMSGGRFRDVNEPFQSDYLDMAQAALTTIFDRLMEPSAAMLEAGEYDDGHPQGEYFGGARLADSWRAMLTKAKEEAGL